LVTTPAVAVGAEQLILLVPVAVIPGLAVLEATKRVLVVTQLLVVLVTAYVNVPPAFTVIVAVVPPAVIPVPLQE
jgi:hypothetical protein